MFLHQIDTDANNSGSRFEGLTADDVEHDARHADLVYDGVLDSFNRKWRLVITGNFADYVSSSLPLSAVVIIIFSLADVLVRRYTGAKAEAWCLLIHADTSLSRGPWRKPGASLYTLTRLSLSLRRCKLNR